jgi:hypothetical protein
MKNMGLLALGLVFATSAQAGDEFVCQVKGNVHLAYSIQLLGSIGKVGSEGKTFDGSVQSFDPMEEGGVLNSVPVPAAIEISEGLPGTRTDGITFVHVLEQDGFDLSLSGELNNDAPFPFYGTANLSPQQTLQCSYNRASGA